MKFTIHCLRPCRPGEEAAIGHKDMRLTAICSEGDNALLAVQDAHFPDGYVPIAWSPEPSRSFGGTRRHFDLYAEAKAQGRLIGEKGGNYIPTDFGPLPDDNVVDAEIPKEGAAQQPADPAPEHCARCGVIYTGGTVHDCTKEGPAKLTGDAAMLSRDALGLQAKIQRDLARQLQQPAAPQAKPSPFTLSPDLAPTSHQIAPAFGSAKIAKGEV